MLSPDVEGGATITDDPDDSGGLTKWGITAQTWAVAQQRGLVLRGKPLEQATRSDASAIYLALYWIPVGADKFPRALSLVVFDAAVNMGVDQAAVLLQRVVKVEQDGVVGPDTVEAASRSPIETLLRFVSARLAAYEQIVQRHPVKAKYHNGWRVRCVRAVWAAARVAMVAA